MAGFGFQLLQLGRFEFVKIEDDEMGVFHQMFEGATAVEMTRNCECWQLLFEVACQLALALSGQMADSGNLVFEVVALNRLNELFEGAMPGDFVEVVKECE